nr:response regulator [uncultured Desulfobacter sp.]
MACHENPPLFSILMVDDEPRNLQLLGTMLEKNNYDTEYALNGQQCFEWLDRKAFDLVLLDIMMPGLDGYQVCRQIKSNFHTRHIPVIFLTARTDIADLVKAFESGCSDFVRKPFMAPELLARIKKEVELKILKGIVPICSHCKKIRDEKGNWNQMEVYIGKHSNAEFSHGICKECAKKYYPDIFEE